MSRGRIDRRREGVMVKVLWARVKHALKVARAASVGTKPVPCEACASRLSRYRGSERNGPLLLHKSECV